MATEIQYPKLPEDFKKKWVDALRSGDYKQGRESLLKDECYCCLGVAGALCGVPKRELEWATYLTSKPPYSISEKSLELIPEPLRGSMGVDLVKKLTTMNDDDEHPFAYIADWIEKNL